MMCNLIQSLHSGDDTPWIFFGDFNLPTSPKEKKGVNPPNQVHVDAFRETLFNFVRDQFTWANGQSWENSIEAHFNRFLATPQWHTLFPEAEVYHLVRHRSDHKPLLLNLTK